MYSYYGSLNFSGGRLPQRADGTTIDGIPFINLAELQKKKTKSQIDALIVNEITHAVIAHVKKLKAAFFDNPDTFSGFKFKDPLLKNVKVPNSINGEEMLSDVASVNVDPDYVFSNLLNQIFTMRFADAASRLDGVKQEIPGYFLVSDILLKYLEKNFPELKQKIADKRAEIGSRKIDDVKNYISSNRSIILKEKLMHEDELDALLDAPLGDGASSTEEILRELAIMIESITIAKDVLKDNVANANKIRRDVPDLFMKCGKELLAYIR